VIDLYALIVVTVILMAYPVYVMIISIIGHLNNAALGMMVVNYPLACIVIQILLINIAAGWVSAALMETHVNALNPFIALLKIVALTGILLLIPHHLQQVPLLFNKIFVPQMIDLIAPIVVTVTTMALVVSVMIIFIIGHLKNVALGEMAVNWQ
jgi:hypothetical protein